MKSFDVVIVGAGPAGQKAAIQARKAGRTVAVVERARHVGGECVHRGTIPSKALRETALQLSAARAAAQVVLPEHVPLPSLMGRVDHIVGAHVAVQAAQLERNGVTLLRGVARFVSPHVLRVRPPDGDDQLVGAEIVVIATGSVPRQPAELRIDHGDVLDSDSILSLPYLPTSLMVLGAGVIACEYATTFASLGVDVTVVDRGERPMAFLDRELSDSLVDIWPVTYRPGCSVAELSRAPGCDVIAALTTGEELRASKVLVALGRVANVATLDLASAGVDVNRRGQIEVDERFHTSAPGVYAVGDVIGFPALATTSMEQGRRAMCYALGLPVSDTDAPMPIGIYTIPALASVGMTEEEALAEHGEIRVGRCRFDEVARGQINGQTDGFLKVLSDVSGERILGVHAAGAPATELVHLGQLAMLGGLAPSVFSDAVMNFPTWGEAYRVVALDLYQDRAVRCRRDAKPAA